MKVRCDFVSNSSSSSFVVLEKNIVNTLFDKYFNDALKYQEFLWAYSYYKYLIFRTSGEFSAVAAKFNEFIANNKQRTHVVSPKNDSTLRDFLLNNVKLFGIKRISDGPHHRFSWMDEYKYEYDGRIIYESRKEDECFDIDQFNTAIDYFANYNAIYVTDWFDGHSETDEWSFIILDFIKTLSEEEAKLFVQSFVAGFSFFQGDEYSVFEAPAEVQIIEKYN